MLRELLKGLRLTGRHLFARKVTVMYPGGEDADEPALPRPARAAPLSQRRRALHRLQACARRCARRSPSPSRASSATTARAAPRATTSTSSKCIFCGFCEESCPVDSIVETHILEYHGETRGDLLYTKPMLLAIGDKLRGSRSPKRRAPTDAAYR